MNQHTLYHYSVTVETEDEVVLHCLRAISDYAQTLGNKRIVWGGTKKKDWQRNNHHVTFHFSNPEYRLTFKNGANRLMPGKFRLVSESNNDPAILQS